MIQQKWPPDLIGKAGLAGELMVTAMQALGCVGLISNGPSTRCRCRKKAQSSSMLLGGVTAGHGEQAVHAINVPVSVGGMDVAPGEKLCSHG